MRIGDEVPDFELMADNGESVRLYEELGKGPVVLFFYPKAMTRGCTQESCHFRDLGAEFQTLGARRLGISADSVERQRQFTTKHDFDYPLLSDPDRRVAQVFGVKRPGPLFNRRATFVIGSDRRLLASIASELNMDKHGDEALSVLRAAQAGQSSSGG